MRIRALLCALILSALIGVPSATAASVTLHASPTTVHRGHSVHLFGTVPGCGGPLTLISRAFRHTHDFAGLPAIYAPLSATGAYSVHPTIPASRTPGKYAVTGRCGGGNIGVSVTLHVIA